MHRTKRNRADTAACSTVKNKERMIFMAVTTESYAGKIQRKLLKKQKVIEAASGRKKADLVLKNATFVNVFSNELTTCDIACANGLIVGLGDYDGVVEYDMTGKIVCPGFIDAHIHLESSLVSPKEFVRATLPHGTTTVITDPHEITNVMGTDGIDYMFQATEGLPIDVRFMLPSCVPATPMDESGANLDYRAIDSFYDYPRVQGLAEMMNAYGVIHNDKEVVSKIVAAQAHHKKIDGHAPGLLGKDLDTYIAAGVYSDHECSTMEDALEKLKLNDASMSYTQENSIALGFGFRCGFLGLLHMEIILERLEREYNLDLITTAPNVVYQITKTDGTELEVYTPLNYPDPAEIAEAREPYAKVNLITPPEYVGAIMDLCTSRRGEFKDMKYLDTTRVELHYSMPLNEIIYDFFDALKSRTRGYGSLDYELEGYRPSKLVKLDILLNGEVVDALSFILFADNAYARARKICEKLKDNIPRQMFEIPVQAAVGGKIIARETIKALRKDVLAKCYGGDITRKKKLLEKQKEGKKRMRTFGTVSVPSEAFMAVLKLDDE